MSTRSFPMPAAAYRAISVRALLIIALTSNEMRASTSVDTTPGTIFVISAPKLTANLSIISLMRAAGLGDFDSAFFFLPYSMASVTSAAYCGNCAAANSNEGLVVASTGLNFLIASISPVRHIHTSPTSPYPTHSVSDGHPTRTNHTARQDLSTRDRHNQSPP